MLQADYARGTKDGDVLDRLGIEESHIELPAWLDA
jgi:hypothetical protein